MKFRKIMKYAGMWVIKLFPTDVKDNNLIGYEIDVEEALKKKRKVKK
jgi:hypothetical protein